MYVKYKQKAAYLKPEHLFVFVENNSNCLNAGINFSRQNLTSIDVRFCRLKSIPAL